MAEPNGDILAGDVRAQAWIGFAEYLLPRIWEAAARRNHDLLSGGTSGLHVDDKYFSNVLPQRILGDEVHYWINLACDALGSAWWSHDEGVQLRIRTALQPLSDPTKRYKPYARNVDLVNNALTQTLGYCPPSQDELRDAIRARAIAIALDGMQIEIFELR